MTAIRGAEAKNVVTDWNDPTHIGLALLGWFVVDTALWT